MAPNNPLAVLAISNLIAPGQIAPPSCSALTACLPISPTSYNGVRPLLILPLGLVKFAQGPLNLRVAQTALRFE